MINKILMCLSNRTGPFLTGLFVPDPKFVPAQVPATIQDLRNRLQLDLVTTDYYLKTYLGVLEAYPDLKQQFNDTQTTYRMTDLLPRGVSIDGAEFVSASGITGMFTDPDDNVMPVNLRYQLDHKSDNLCQITSMPQGGVLLAAVKVFPTSPSKTLIVDWPATVPFKGGLRMLQDWQQGARVRIDVEPSKFPFADLMKQVTGAPVLSQLLPRFNLVNEFNHALSDVEKLAIVLTALGLAHPAARK